MSIEIAKNSMWRGRCVANPPTRSALGRSRSSEAPLGAREDRDMLATLAWPSRLFALAVVTLLHLCRLTIAVVAIGFVVATADRLEDSGACGWHFDAFPVDIRGAALSCAQVTP